LSSENLHYHFSSACCSVHTSRELTNWEWIYFVTLQNFKQFFFFVVGNTFRIVTLERVINWISSLTTGDDVQVTRVAINWHCVTVAMYFTLPFYNLWSTKRLSTHVGRYSCWPCYMLYRMCFETNKHMALLLSLLFRYPSRDCNTVVNPYFTLKLEKGSTLEYCQIWVFYGSEYSSRGLSGLWCCVV